jgi:hypothetical protein
VRRGEEGIRTNVGMPLDVPAEAEKGQEDPDEEPGCGADTSAFEGRNRRTRSRRRGHTSDEGRSGHKREMLLLVRLTVGEEARIE